MLSAVSLLPFFIPDVIEFRFLLVILAKIDYLII
jgi:hypothetical protein